MEKLQHAAPARRKSNSARVNLTLSILFHGVIAALAFFWAAHEGMLGKKLRELSVLLVQREKKADEPKKEEPKPEPGKTTDQPKPTETARRETPPPPKFVPPPAQVEAGAAPPPVAVLPSFTFGEPQNSTALAGPIEHYKAQAESMLKARWNRPNDVADLNYVAEAEITLDSSGTITSYEIKRGSGDKKWDDSVVRVLATLRGFNRPPPQGFPERFVIRFDVEEAAEPALR